MPLTNAGREFDALFNNAAIGILVASSSGEIIMANDFCLRQFGYKKEELLHQQIEILIPMHYRKGHTQLRKQFNEGEAHSRPMGAGRDLFGIKKDQTEFPVEVSLSPYDANGERFTIAFISDITVRKKSEQALLHLNAKLEKRVEERTQSLTEALAKEKELNELKSRFVSMASHEFRTPLSTILSSAYLISQYTKTEDQTKREKHILRIISSGNMLNDILNDFLSVGKIEEGRIQIRFAPFNIEERINELLKELNTILKPNQKLTYSHLGESMVLLDLSLFRNILMNLVSNAVKFSEEGKEITIRTYEKDHKLVLEIADQGIGISAADQEHLFERFFRGENVSNIQGTGLGLHIVAKYVELMHGNITFTSQLQVGTTFIIHFNKAYKSLR